jgi:hypothetical protein
MAEAVVLEAVVASMVGAALAVVAAFTAEALRVPQAEELIAGAGTEDMRVLRGIVAAMERMVAEDPMGRTRAVEAMALTGEAALMAPPVARPVMAGPVPLRLARISGVRELPMDNGMVLAALQDAVQLHPAAR